MMEHTHTLTYNATGSEDIAFPDEKITFEFDANTDISGMLYQFEKYMKACGFSFEGHFELINDFPEYDGPIPPKITTTSKSNKRPKGEFIKH
tara:strand:- start:21406 stop:21681 length:276 start_codon:yes stop_codon:yes gene_type:complete